MVRMVDLVKGGGDEDPKSQKNKKAGSSGGDLPGETDSPGPRKGEEGENSIGMAVASSGTAGSRGGAFRNNGGPVPEGLGEPGSRGGNLRSTSLGVKSRYCPYLGGRKTREKIIDYPVVSNVCYAKGSQEKKLLRTLNFPFSVIPAQRQREFCLAAYPRCPLYQVKQKGESA